MQTVDFLWKTYPTSGINVGQTGVHYFGKDPTDRVDKGLLLLEDLAWINTFTVDPAENTKYYGMVCGEVNPPGVSNSSQSGMGFGDQAWGIRAGQQTYGGALMAQEIAHTVIGGFPGLPPHAPGCGSYSPHFDNYPNGSGLIEEVGFDGSRVYAPAYDFMSYCPDASHIGPNWVSKYVYKKLFSKFWPYGGAE
jgi:hypothetical protein